MARHRHWGQLEEEISPRMDTHETQRGRSPQPKEDEEILATDGHGLNTD